MYAQSRTFSKHRQQKKEQKMSKMKMDTDAVDASSCCHQVAYLSYHGS